MMQLLGTVIGAFILLIAQRTIKDIKSKHQGQEQKPERIGALGGVYFFPQLRSVLSTLFFSNLHQEAE